MARVTASTRSRRSWLGGSTISISTCRNISRNPPSWIILRFARFRPQPGRWVETDLLASATPARETCHAGDR